VSHLLKLSQSLPFVALLGAFTLFGPAPPHVMRELVKSEAFSAAHPNCMEWSDACTTCLRDADKISCSLPGIACQPAEMVCKKGE